MHLRHQQAIFHSCKPKCMRNYSSQQNWSLPHLLVCNRDGVWFIPEDITRCATTLLRTCWDNISHPLRPNQSAVKKKKPKKTFSRFPSIMKRTQCSLTALSCRHGESKSPHVLLVWLMEGVMHIFHGLNRSLEPLLPPTGFRDWHLKSHREESGLEGLIWSLWSQGSRWECSQLQNTHHLLNITLLASSFTRNDLLAMSSLLIEKQYHNQ